MNDVHNISPVSSVCFGWCLQTGRGIPIDFTGAAEFLSKKAAESNDADGMNSFGCRSERSQAIDQDIDRTA
jgi:TPR repeat protein